MSQRSPHAALKDNEGEGNKEREEEVARYMEELQSAYWLPYKCKWIAWLLSLTTIGVSCVVLVLYGLSFGPVKSRLWLTSVFTTEGINMALVQPLKALVLAFISSHVLKLEYRLHHRPVTLAMLQNPPLPPAPLHPRRATPQYYLPPREPHITKRRVELRAAAAIADARWHLAGYLLMLLVLYVLAGSDSSATSPSTAAAHSTVTAMLSNTHPRPLHAVSTYQQWLDYVNVSLVPCIMMTGSEKDRDDTVTKMTERVRTVQPDIKLLGSPRIRQRRVLPRSCEVGEQTGRNDVADCGAELSWYNEDTRHYKVGWTEPSMTPSPPPADNPSSDTLAHTDMEREPWTYRGTWESGGVWGYRGRVSRWTWGGGGYVVNLGKTVSNTRRLLHSLHYFSWVDSHTRHLYIDMTLYSINTNLFHIVTIMFEFSAAGVVVPSLKLRTERLLYEDTWQLLLSVLVTLALLLIVCWNAILHCFRIYNLSLTHYFASGWRVVDVLVVVLGASAVLSIMCRSLAVSSVMSQMDEAASNEYVSFEYVALFAQLANTFIASTIFLWTLKAVTALNWSWAWKQWEGRLLWAWPVYTNLLLLMLCVITPSVLLLHVICGKYDEGVSEVYSGVGRAVAGEQTILRHPLEIVTYVTSHTLLIALALSVAISLQQIPPRDGNIPLKTLVARTVNITVGGNARRMLLKRDRLEDMKWIATNVVCSQKMAAQSQLMPRAKLAQMERLVCSILRGPT